MKKEDLKDFLARNAALMMVPFMEILLESQTEGIHVDPDEAAAKLSKKMKQIILKGILDYENIRPGGTIDLNESIKACDEVKQKLRDLEKEIFK